MKKRYKLMHRIGADAIARRAEGTGSDWSADGLVRRMRGARENCIRVGCDVRDSVILKRPGFVAERDGVFYEAFELVEVEGL